MRIACLFVALACAFANAAEITHVSNVDELKHAIRGGGVGARIELAAGTYFLDEPLVLTAAQSGLTIEAAAGASPVISGGRRIDGWHAAKLNGRDCWAATVADVKAGKWFFRDLWVNGQRAIRARTPNSGEYFHVVASPDASGEWNVGQTRFRFQGSDIPAGPFAERAEVMVMTRWVESRMPIKSVEPDQHIVNSYRHSHFRMEAGDPYWLEGDGRWLDQPGEWFLDRANGVLYYLPLPGQKMDQVEAIAPRLPVVLKIEGKPAEKKFVENVTIRGITFSHTEWMQAEANTATTKPSDAGFDQAATPVPGANPGGWFTGLYIFSLHSRAHRQLRD